MKTCSKCRIEKTESDFTRDKSRPSGLSIYCRSCESQKGKRRYEFMTPEQRDHYNEMCRRRYHGEYTKEKSPEKLSPSDIRAIKSSRGCLVCGESDHFSLDFHHVGEKTAGIGYGKNMPKSSLLLEISKCVVLCANCHRKLHAGRWQLTDLSGKIAALYPDAYALMVS